VGVLTKESLIRKQIVLMAGDIAAAVFILFFIYMMNQNQADSRLFMQPWYFLFIPALIFSSFICEIYTVKTWQFRSLAVRAAIATGICFLILILVAEFSAILWWLVFGLICFYVLQILWHSFYQFIVRSSLFVKPLMVIGTGTTALQVERMISASANKYSLIGYISTPSDPVDVAQDKIIGKIDDIVELCRQHKVHSIVMALTEKRGNLAIAKLVACKLIGVRIIDYPNFYETMTGKIPVESINPSWLVQSNGFLITPLVRFLKRIFDIILSALVLLITLPFFPLFVFFVKYKSPGPVFYLQKRVGEFGKDFTIYKFRSMVTDAESMSGAAWASENDPRVSPFGHLMRKTRIDELPQLINVLKGDMSFIGPRPERPEFVKQISENTPYYMERHAVKPGITGWAQVMYPYGSSIGDSVEKLRYDLYYINNLSLFLELLIVFETIKVIVFRRGGR